MRHNTEPIKITPSATLERPMEGTIQLYRDNSERGYLEIYTDGEWQRLNISMDSTRIDSLFIPPGQTSQQ